jgi:integrase
MHSGPKGTRSERLRVALADLKIEREGQGWYECTRHTIASQWVMHGGSIEKLKEILGHYSVIITERYAHLRPDLFRDEDLATLPEISQPMASGRNVVGIRFRNRKQNAGAAL